MLRVVHGVFLFLRCDGIDCCLLVRGPIVRRNVAVDATRELLLLLRVNTASHNRGGYAMARPARRRCDVPIPGRRLRPHLVLLLITACQMLSKLSRRVVLVVHSAASLGKGKCVVGVRHDGVGYSRCPALLVS